VRLTNLERRHLDRTLEWTNDPELMRLLGRKATVTREEHERWFADLSSARDRHYLAIEYISDGAHIGNVWLWAIDAGDRKAELRIVIGARDHVGRGEGTEAIELACRHAFADLGLRRVYAYVLDFNERARRAFEKAGFSVEGRLRADRLLDGRAVDTYLLAKVRAD
jgi:RimJ/RimL family protein N-acetyltransferase